MDAATLRIILLILGALLLGAIYFRERRRMDERAGRRPSRRRPAVGARRREPRLAGRKGSHTGADEAPAARRRQAFDEVTDEVAPPVEEEQPNMPDAFSVSMEGLDQGAQASPSDAGGRERAEVEADDGKLLVQLFIVTLDQAFSGRKIEAAARRLQLVPGKMAIYHRQGREGNADEPRFSMANLVNPGTFPFDEMDAFSSPGLALFTEFEGLPSDLMVYDELVQTARSLADELGGALRLADRSPFDEAAWERIREQLLQLINDRTDALG